MLFLHCVFWSSLSIFLLLSLSCIGFVASYLFVNYHGQLPAFFLWLLTSVVLLYCRRYPREANIAATVASTWVLLRQVGSACCEDVLRQLHARGRIVQLCCAVVVMVMCLYNEEAVIMLLIMDLQTAIYYRVSISMLVYRTRDEGL